MDKITKAIELAARVHYGQTDKSGEPYILHALTVMRYTDKENPTDDQDWRQDLLVTAVLHDAIEDFEGSDVEHVDLHEQIVTLFGMRVYKALISLTHDRGEPYLDEYIPRVAGNGIARRVKIADLTHNMDPRRLPEGEIGDREYRRWSKYRTAIVRLKNGRKV